MGKNDIIILIAVVAVLFVGAKYFGVIDTQPKSQSLLELSPDPTSQTFSRGERLVYPYPNWNENDYTGEYDELDVTGDGVYTLEDYEYYVYGNEYDDYGEYGLIGYPEKNKCGYKNYGYPSYIGTQKEGQDCRDATINENDLECFANPPYNYDGERNLATGIANPKIVCCVADGTCQWGYE